MIIYDNAVVVFISTFRNTIRSLEACKVCSESTIKLERSSFMLRNQVVVFIIKEEGLKRALVVFAIEPRC